MKKVVRRISNISKYGLGPEGRARKQADKARQRHERFFESDRWQVGEDEARRQYASYDEYLGHQASKLDQIVDRLQETEADDLEEFKRRFASCAPLRAARSVLCLGARLGTEVKALHALGHFAIGIDLNPGKDNAYVLPGDFHRLVFPDGSLDAVYTNALDHVFALDKVIGEVRRVLRPGGLFVTDLELGYDEGFTPGEYEATHWRDQQSLIEKIRTLGAFEVDPARDLGKTRRDQWTQVVFRKPASTT